MLHSELKLGMTVKANEESNDKYIITKEAYGCEGVVTEIDGKYFSLKVTEHQRIQYIGNKYEVEVKYFDLVEEIKEEKVEKNMKVELKKVNVGLDFECGDLLVSDKGRFALVMADFDGEDYRAVLLDEKKITDCRGSEAGLLDELEEENFGKVTRVIKASNLKLSEI